MTYRNNRPQILALLVTLFIALQAAAEQNTPKKTCQFPSDRTLGHYTIYPDRERKHYTFRELEESVARDIKFPMLEGGELRGVVSYPYGAGLGIVIGDDSHGGVLEKLKSLDAIDPKDVTYLLVTTRIDLKCLKLIERFSNLRDLTLVVDEATDGEQGCASLACLRKLRYLNLSMENSCVFGSKRFCEVVRSLDQLEYLSIPCEKLTDENVAVLAGHPSLNQIHLRSRRPVLGSKSLQALRNNRRLRELFIVCVNTIADSDLVAFTEIKSLEMIHVVTSAPLSCQERMKQRRPDCWFFFDEPSNEIE